MHKSFSGKFLLLGLLVCLFAACDSWQEGWTAEYQTEFKNACLSGDGRGHADPSAYCDCVMAETMKRYPTIHSFMEMKDTAQYREALLHCP